MDWCHAMAALVALALCDLQYGVHPCQRGLSQLAGSMAWHILQAPAGRLHAFAPTHCNQSTALECVRPQCCPTALNCSTTPQNAVSNADCPSNTDCLATPASKTGRPFCCQPTPCPSHPAANSQGATASSLLCFFRVEGGRVWCVFVSGLSRHLARISIIISRSEGLGGWEA